MHVVELGGGDLLIHSPTHVDERTYDAIAELGRPRWLFAPNHFHHLSLDRYQRRFPDAVPIASRGALPRLRRKGHADLVPIDQVELPAGIHFLVPDATKSGEAWLSIDGGASGPTWIVCDAFFHETRPITGVQGFFLRRLNISPDLCIGSTFTLMCISDDAKYAADVRRRIDEEKPARVLFSHGEPLEADVPTALHGVLRRRLG